MDPIEGIVAASEWRFPPAGDLGDGMLAVRDPAYRTLLSVSNGLVGFGGALHVFGVGPEVTPWHRLATWNDPTGWRAEFGHLLDEGWCFFAESVFGDQFFQSSDGAICRVLSETAHVDRTAISFSEWLIELLRDPDQWCDRSVLLSWTARSGVRQSAWKHLCPTVPFCLGGAISVGEDAYIADPLENMRFKGQLARQISTLRRGDRVNLRALNLPRHDG